MSVIKYLKSTVEQPDYRLLDADRRKLALGKPGFFCRCIRFFLPNEARKQDLKVAELVYQRLRAVKPRDFEQSFNDAKIFIDSHQGVHTKLDDLFYAHKVKAALGIEVTRLLGEKSGPGKGLLHFLRKNHLQNVIPKADERNKKTAIIFKKNRAYIRSKEYGRDFLSCRRNVKLILKELDGSHPDFADLRRLRTLFRKSTKFGLDQAGLVEMRLLRKKLQKHNYSYIPVDRLSKSKSGQLSNLRFLIHGIEECRVKHWNGQLKASHLENANDEKFEMRVITRLPSYSTEKGMKFITSLFSHLLTFLGKGHGHSWVEIAKPAYDEKGVFTGQKEVTSVGFFLSQGMKSPDPSIYVPILKKKVEKFTLTEKEYETSVKYINHLNKMVNVPKRKWTAVPSGDDLSCVDVKKITRIYKSMIKGTCTNFVSELKNQILGMEQDLRGSIRKTLFPQKFIRFLDEFDGIFEKNVYLKMAMTPFSFLIRVQLPYTVA